ncbi:MAG: adenosylmethionine decarboxylase [Alphaproteobacteria bacterium]|nr:adenosylmethionine decarboxylase [Alphaproteobacteria bacterium]
MKLSPTVQRREGSFEPDQRRTQETPKTAETNDHFVVDEFGICCAGHHLIIDMWGVKASFLADLSLIKSTMMRAVCESEATLLNIDLHHFEPNFGVSGMAILAESHISIHTWPERGYAAIDAFMCGDSRPERCVKVFQERFAPQSIQMNTIRRGVIVG